MRKIIAILLSLFAILFCTNIQAESANTAKWYQIELIIFSHITAQALNSEHWPWTNNRYVPKPRTIELNFSSGANYGILAPSYFLMQREQARISKQARYQVLLHLAWRQQIRHPRHARPIHIFGGNAYNSSGKVIASNLNGNAPYDSNAIWQVDGTFRISVRRYFDVNANLLFTVPTSQLSRISKTGDFDNIQGKFAYFRLLQSRRMRSKELNYIGYPLYGILVKVIPLKEKKSV